jgi:hypothetical protein
MIEAKRMREKRECEQVTTKESLGEGVRGWEKGKKPRRVFLAVRSRYIQERSR